MLTGQNGILNRASEAKDKTGISQEEESVKLSISDALTQGLGSITTENLQTALTNNGLKGSLTGNGPWVYTGDYKKYDIGTSGSMTSSDQNNSSSEKIVKLMGNYGVSEDGKFFEMDVDMENLSYETWTEVNKKSELSEIGKIKKSVAYKGMFFVITENGDLYGWGNNEDGQLGIGSDMENQASPVKVTGVSNVEDIYCGTSGSTFVKTKTGEVYAFGYNRYGQLGIGIKGDQQTPVKLNSLTNIEKIYTTGYSSFAKTISGDIYAWGSNSGDLGTGNTDYQLSPVKISQVSNVDEMIVDNKYGTAYARTTNSKIYCMSEENYLPGIFDVSKQGLNLEENDEICNIDIVKYKGNLIDQVKVINTIQGHMYVYYIMSMPE